MEHGRDQSSTVTEGSKVSLTQTALERSDDIDHTEDTEGLNELDDTHNALPQDCWPSSVDKGVDAPQKHPSRV